MKQEHSEDLMPLLCRGLAEWTLISDDDNSTTHTFSTNQHVSMNIGNPEIIHVLATIILQHQQERQNVSI